jgi:hypothetical protein
MQDRQFFVARFRHLVTLSPCHLATLSAWGMLATLIFSLAPALAEAPADPLPLQRIIVPADRIAAELERVRQGVLVQQPRAEFEALVKQAADALKRGKNPPRLTQAHYRARLMGVNLVGSGEWKIFNPTTASAILPMPALNLALSRVKVGAGDAIMGDLDGKALGLFLPTQEQGAIAAALAPRSPPLAPGPLAVTFDWTLRGGQEAGGLHFELQIPPCPVASLELTLPRDATVSVSRSVAVLSQQEADDVARQRVWRLDFTDRSTVDLIIHHAEDPLPNRAFIVTTLTSTQRLTPERLRADFEFQVEVQHRPIRQLLLDVDPQLEPFEVSLRNLGVKEWKIIQPAEAGEKSEKAPLAQHRPHRTLVVELREPAGGTLPALRVRCLARLASDQPWSSPWMRLRDAAVQGETLKLEISPDVRLENWAPGDFRLVQASTAPDGSQLLNLVGTEIRRGAALRRPAARVRTQGVDFLARQRTWWQIGTQGSSLTAEILYEVNRGNLIELPVVLPGGWQVNDVTMEPRELLRNWVLVSSGDRSSVVVDLHRALTPRQQGRLTIRLHSSQGRSLPSSATAFEFPELAPPQPCVRENTLAIKIDPVFEATVLRASVPASTADAAGPWGLVQPTFSFNARNQPVSGLLRVARRPPMISAQCKSQFVIAPNTTGVSIRLDVETQSGTLRALDLWLSAPLPQGVIWKCVSHPDLIRGVERLPTRHAAQYLHALVQHQGLAAAIALSIPGRGERWRITLNRALKKRETFVLETSLIQPDSHVSQAPEPGNWHWQLPLVTVPSAFSFEGEASLHLVGTEVTRVAAGGLTDTTKAQRRQAEGTPAKGGQPDPSRVMPRAGSAASRVYAYANGNVLTDLPALYVRGKNLPPDRAAQEICDHALLVTQLEPGGPLVHSFSFSLWNWRRRMVPVRLPAGARLLTARVDGRWLDHPSCSDTPEAVEVGLPVPGDEGLHRLEMVYTTPQEWPGWRIAAVLNDPAPQLPVPPTSFKQTWRLSPGVAPLDAERFRRVPSVQQTLAVTSWWETPQAVWRTGNGWLAELAGLPPEGEWSARQRQAVEAAETALRQQTRPDQPWSLGAALEQLALSLSKEGIPLVVEAVALQEARLSPRTTFTLPQSAPGSGTWHPFWESLGLIYIPAHGGALLTRHPDGSALADVARGVALSASLEKAIRSAGTEERDPSGRFRSVWDWAAGSGSRGGPDETTASSLEGTDNVKDKGHGPWTEWEPIAGGTGPQRLIVVREDAVGVLGWVLTGFLVLLAWCMKGFLSPRRRFWLLIAWLGAAVLAVLWLPASLRAAAWGPALAATVFALAWYGWLVGRQHAMHPRVPAEASGVKKILAGTVTTGIGLFFALSAFLSMQPHVQSQQPESFPVLLVPNSDSGQEMALVTPDLLDRLGKIAAALPAARGVVPIQAIYEGKVAQGQADFKAEFRVYNFSDRAMLTLPLTGVELSDAASVDGSSAYPALLPAPQSGYSLPVVGPGMHTVQVSFTCRVSEVGEQVDLTFGVPRLPQTRVVISLPAGASTASVLSALGLQKSAAAENGRVRVEADLGREDSVHLRWRPPSRSSKPLTMQVREAYLYDLRQPTPTLTAVLNYTPAGGAMSRFTIQLPPGIDVRSVEARQGGASPESNALPRLKVWRTLTAEKKSGASSEDGTRYLQVDLQTPFASPLQLTLGLVPQLAAGAAPLLLALPTPQECQLTEGFLAYRVNNWDILDKAHYLGVTNLAATAFVQIWTAAGMPDPGPPNRAYTFRRTPGGVPGLTLTLHEPRPQATQEVNWYVQRGYADVRARAEVTSGHEDVMLIEWVVPAEMTVADVRGSDVDHWSRTGDRVQTWLRSARKTTTIELSGWVSWTPSAGQAQGQVVLPAVLIGTATVKEPVIHVGWAPGLNLEPAKLQDLILAPEQTPNLLSYRAKEAVYRAVFNVRLAPANRSDGRGTRSGSREKKTAPSSLAPRSSFQVLGVEQQAVLAAGGRWVHQGDYLLLGDSPDIHLDLPAGARLLGVVLDGRPHSPRQASSESLTISLAASAVPHHLAVRWSFEPGAEQVDTPNLASPRLEGTTEPTGVWIILVPAAYELKKVGKEVRRGGGLAERESYRAEVMAKLSAHLTEPQQVRLAQKAFFSHLRRADYEVTLAGQSLALGVGQATKLRTRLQALRLQNERWAREHGMERIRSDAEKQPEQELIRPEEAFFSLEGAGRAYWFPAADGQPPRLRLAVREDPEVRQTLLVTELFLLFLVGVLALAYSPGVAAWVRRFWPEQLMLVAFLGFEAFGLSPLGVLLFVGAALFRLAWIASAIRKRFARQTVSTQT